MAGLGRTVACLRVFGDELNPDELTSLLGKIPTSSARKGDVKVKRGQEIVVRGGSWIIEAEDCSPGDLNAQVVKLLAGLNSDLAVWQDLCRRYRCDVFCGLFMEKSNEGEELSSETMAMLGARGLSLGLDIYDSTPD